jgi:hypothetical protein
MYAVSPLKFYVAGAGLIASSVAIYQQKRRKSSSWKVAVATVQNIHRRHDGDSRVYARFKDELGELRTANLVVADEDAIGLGSELEICYNPGNPEDAMVQADADRKRTFVIPFIIGVFLLVGGALCQYFLPPHWK